MSRFDFMRLTLEEFIIRPLGPTVFRLQQTVTESHFKMLQESFPNEEGFQAVLNSLATAQLLEECGSEKNVEIYVASMLLCHAIAEYEGNMKIMHFLITKHNADPRIRDDSDGESALSLALEKGDFVLIQRLCSYKYPAQNLSDDMFAVGQICTSIAIGKFAEVEYDDIIDVLQSIYKDIHMHLSSKIEKYPPLTFRIEKDTRSHSSDEEAPTHQSCEPDKKEVETLDTLAL